MCGIVGGISERNVVPIILEGLSRLEYRGYDSVGIAVIDSDELVRERSTGRVKHLIDTCNTSKIKGLVGIGHTRWATHGGVTINNAHPHFSNNTLAIVHNGIIENYLELREELKNKGYVFESQTDTEVIVHLIHFLYLTTKDLLEAVIVAIKKLRGAYAIAVMNQNNPGELVCARLGSPLVVGVGINEMFFASDVSALLPVTQKLIYLEDGDVAYITKEEVKFYDQYKKLVNRDVHVSKLSTKNTELGNYRHYMQKEIFEQPMAISDTINSLGSSFNSQAFGNEAKKVFQKITKVQIIACGTSYNAGSIAKYWIEEFANLECAVDIASEYHYRRIVPNPETLIVNISQSGETIDTLTSVKYAHSLGMINSLSICNVPESALVRLSKLSILTHAGPEIGVASTKAFTTQLVVLLYLANVLAKEKGLLAEREEKERIEQVRKLPQLVTDLFNLEPGIKEIAKDLESKNHALFLGRNTLCPVAIEGALKLKEISYIHAEGYAAGELKHGPLALIDKDMPVIVVLPQNILYEKVKSNVEEVLARNGVVYIFTDKVDKELENKCKKVLYLKTEDIAPYLLPILYTIPLQLLAYHTAINKGTDVDKPRNLAKSVTVE